MVLMIDFELILRLAEAPSSTRYSQLAPVYSLTTTRLACLLRASQLTRGTFPSHPSR
jgi:hypothetical protein